MAATTAASVHRRASARRFFAAQLNGDDDDNNNNTGPATELPLSQPVPLHASILSLYGSSLSFRLHDIVK
jgi:hypothetical protein